MKMAVIGLGKQKEAETVHRNGFCELGTMLPCHWKGRFGTCACN